MIHRKALIAGALLASLVASSASHAAITYVTNFDKDNNIYTNLNEQYPNTGVGVPGSGVGVVNASNLWSPPPTGAGNLQNNVNNGVSFDLVSDAAGHDFSQIGAGAGFASLTLPIDVKNAGTLYLLMGAYDGVSFNITLNGSGGASQTFSSIFIPDFNGGSINSVSGGVADQTVFQVQDVGAGGSGNSTTGSFNKYGLTEVGLTLGSQFSGQTLQSATLTSNGYETLLLGATVASSAVSGVPEPATWALMMTGIGLVGGMIRLNRRRGQALGAGALPG